MSEIITHTWQTAHKMRQQRGRRPEDTGTQRPNNNFRARRYVAKYTINPAHGMAGGQRLEHLVAIG